MPDVAISTLFFRPTWESLCHYYRLQKEGDCHVVLIGCTRQAYPVGMP